MNNTKTIFKSLLIMIVAISLFTVSCSKDEGGTKTPTNPKPITITAENITQGINATLKTTKMVFDYQAPSSGNAVELKATAAATTQNDLDVLKTLKITVSGATVDAKVTTDKFPEITTNTDIAITITITPTSGNSFAADLKPYTAADGKVTVKLTLKPQDTKKWNGQ